MRKYDQIRPNKSVCIYDLRIAISEPEVRSEMAEHLNDLVRAKAALKRPHSRCFARYGNRIAVAKRLETGGANG